MSVGRAPARSDDFFGKIWADLLHLFRIDHLDTKAYLLRIVGKCLQLL